MQRRSSTYCGRSLAWCRRWRRVVPLAVIPRHYRLDAELKRVGSQPCGSLELVAEIEHLDVRGAAKLVAEWFAIPSRVNARAIERHRKGVRKVSGKPSHKCFVVEDRGEGDDNDAFWTRVGSAWPHKDGKGLNVVLSALPTNGRLVLRDYTPEDEKVDDEKENKRKSATRR